MSKILVFGSLLQDIFLKLPPENIVESDQQLHFTIGKKYHVNAIHTAVGGGGANMAVALARLAHDVYLSAAVGNDDIGNSLMQHMAYEQVATNYIETKEEKTGFSLLFPSVSGNQTIFSYTGANSDLSKTISNINQFEMICIAPLHGQATKNVFDILKKKQTNLIVFINPSIDQITDQQKNLYRLFKYVDIVQCNYQEARLCLSNIVKTKKDNLFLSSNCKELDLFFTYLHNQGVSVVIVTKGKDGISVSDHGTVYRVKMPFLLVKNTAGAGDAFGATFLSEYSGKKSIETCITSAVMNVTSVLQSYDAQAGLLKKEIIENNRVNNLEIIKV